MYKKALFFIFLAMTHSTTHSMKSKQTSFYPSCEQSMHTQKDKKTFPLRNFSGKNESDHAHNSLIVMEHRNKKNNNVESTHYKKPESKEITSDSTQTTKPSSELHSDAAHNLRRHCLLCLSKIHTPAIDNDTCLYCNAQLKRHRKEWSADGQEPNDVSFPIGKIIIYTTYNTSHQQGLSPEVFTWQKQSYLK